MPQQKPKKSPAAGITLVEILIAIAISSFLILAGSQVVSWAVSRYTELAEKFEAERNLMTASFYIKNFLSQAIVMQAHGDANLNAYTTDANGTGRLREYHATNGVGGNTDTIAVFVREIGSAAFAPPAGSSRFTGSGIFFQRPTPATSGVLYVDPGQGPGTFAVSPRRSALFWGRFVEFEVEDLNLQAAGLPAAGTTLQSARVRMVLRYFRGLGGNNSMWCPVANITGGTAGCVAQSPYRDIESNFTVYFRNNIISQGILSTGASRVYGNTYFFDAFIPYNFRR